MNLVVYCKTKKKFQYVTVCTRKGVRRKVGSKARTRLSASLPFVQEP